MVLKVGSAGLIYSSSFSGGQRQVLLLNKLNRDAQVVLVYLRARNWKCFKGSCVNNVDCLLIVEMHIILIYFYKHVFQRQQWPIKGALMLLTGNSRTYLRVELPFIGYVFIESYSSVHDLTVILSDFSHFNLYLKVMQCCRHS